VCVPEQVDDPLIGKVLSGRFEIVAPLGVGGMGRVYKAVQRPLDRMVALKVLNPRYDGSKDPGFEKRFFLEASMTAKLKHPNTITVHDYGRTDDGIFYIAMEYVEGETLQQALSRGPFSWPRALFVGAQIARSLREAHKLGLVHRDLKPANIMLIAEGTGGDVVKVLDFGLVKSFMVERPQTEHDSNNTEITQAGVLLGSPMYMAPEQARNEADQRTDLYALGVLLFQCMAGRPPFLGKESIDVIVKHIREKPPELRSLVPEVPLEVNALVMKCLEKEPAARFQSMDELLEAMRAATAGQGMSGVFADPRSASSTMIPRAFSQGSSPRVPTTSPVPSGEQATPAQTRVEGGVLLPDSSVPVEFALSVANPTPRRTTMAVVLGLSALGIAVGAGVAWKLTRPMPVSTPVVTPTTVVAPPKHEEPRPPMKVSFDISSSPSGATVTHAGLVLGVTPLSFKVDRVGESPAQEAFVVSLAGYQDQTVSGRALQGVVSLTAVLEKAPAPTPTPQNPKTHPRGPKNPKTDPKPDNPTGYKDDPYQ
jgi:serine/threonine-protein kinase